ncbi:RHS repeat-associated core domain-containing protein [Pyxidicoccus sp. MSG2]|uniref:RHS repeat-associated core domain-containing protein n=1 Tax=Pyxidicoccus sp. MSG2 TaxID=2996790 RepID=UPI00226F5F08|nr:RHS repeat-associated core domain-containing protein [Pyxidicoccus sp. MSG2]MCY1019868.1 hypothetical protein [Pyxidicoccus sp. MSG2]
MDGENLGPCRPSTAQPIDVCNNGCDEDRDGEADENCAGGSTFDYCERNPSGSGYTRWTCGCGDGLNVGYCLGSGDSQASCSGGSGCLKAPAFGTSGASQAGGNFQCCVSSKPCYAEGYDTTALHCAAWNTPNFECTPGSSCDDSNACGNTCAGIAPQVDRTTGTRVGSGAYCAAGPVCSQAQGGFGTPGNGVRAMLDSYIEVCGLVEYEFGASYTCTEVPYRPAPVESLPPRDGPGGSPGGGGGNDGDDGSDEGDPDAKDPEPKTCGPATEGSEVVGAAVSAMSVPRVQLNDFTTRHTEADLGLHGELGGFNFVRKYVSTDTFWSYQSMLGASGEPFVPKPFGSSPSRQTSMRWWHTLYSFVHQQGLTAGVSTWTVRDTDGEVLEFFACKNTGSGCFATPRKTSRWSNASLFFAGGSYVLIKPGVGRYVYASGWAASGAPIKRYFLTRIEEDRLTGTPRVRLSLDYAPQTLVNPYGQTVVCPGQSTLGNGVPYLATVTTEEGSKLRLYYRVINSRHSSPATECVLDRLAMRKNPNSTDSALSQEEVTVAQYRYPVPSGFGFQAAGLLSSVEYPETGDVVTYGDSTTTTSTATEWNVSVNQSSVAAHQYVSGKVASLSTGTTAATAMTSGSGDCSGPDPMSGGSTCVPPAAEPASGSAGDSAGSTVKYRRTLFPTNMSYSPHSVLGSYRDECLASTGNCTSFSPGWVHYGYEEPASGSLFLRYMSNKAGRFDFHNKTFAAAGTASVPGVVSPMQGETRGYGQDYYGAGGVVGTATDYIYASIPSGAVAQPWKPVKQTVNSIASVLQSGGQALMRTTYDEASRFTKSVIRSGYTQTFDAASGAWSGSVLRHVGTFYFNHHRCSGGTDVGGTVVKEVHGPCTVSGPEATDCSGNDYPITQYHYYGPPSVERSNRANRLMKVSRYTYHAGTQGCAPYPPLETVYGEYDSRGNPTQVTTPQGGVTTFVYRGGRLESMTSQGLTSTLLYDGAQLRAARRPAGDYTVYCYRTGTTAGQGCTGGTKTSLLQWVATASDENGADWSEMTVKTYWPDGSLKTEEARSRRSGVEESRRVTEYHPDPHRRPAYTRQGSGPGSFASVTAFDLNGNTVGLGQPFDGAPDFCRNPDQSLSALCTSLGYDSADRLNRMSETFPSGTQQHTTFAYDAQGNVNAVRAGCSSPTAGCGTLASYQYDDFGNLVQVKLPHATGPVRQAYDALGHLRVKQSEAMRQGGEWLEYDFDLLGRLTTAARRKGGSSPINELLFRFAYDVDGAVPSYCGSDELYSVGLLRFRDDSFGRTWYRYDLNGRLVAELRQRQGDPGCTPELETRYTYDGVGRLSGMLYPYGRTVSYVYGTGANAHRVSAIDVNLFTATGAESRRLVSNITWEPFGGLRGYQLNPPSGTARAVEYALGDNGTLAPANCAVGFPSALDSDRTGRTRSLRVSSGAFTPGSGSGDIYKRTYTWKADQVARTDTCLLGATTPRTELFDYDQTLRLASATRPTGNDDATGGAFYSQTFGYDRRSNRTSFLQSGGYNVTHLTYDTGDTVDRLLSATPQHDAFQRVAFLYDADGRAVRKESGRYTSGAAANVLELGYGPFDASGQGSARESVFRAVRVNGATYNYYYDALGRRRAKVNPFGQRDEYFHGVGNALLVDQGWNQVIQAGFRVVDDYVLLGGLPVVMLRGRLDASLPVRQPDTTADCQRNGEATACGAYFPVMDPAGKPVLMLDGAGRVAGAADYQPFGHVNRVQRGDLTAHPYADDDSESISGFSQPPENAQVKVRMRGIFQLVDTQDDQNGVDDVTLLDSDTGALLARLKGAEQGRRVTPWMQPSAGHVVVNFTAGPEGDAPNTYTGVVVEAYEYQRYQTGAQPFWTPLRLPGQYHDEETDLFENWNRYYDASAGRYLQPEPLLSTGAFVRPAYAYAGNNPLHYADPDGRDLIIPWQTRLLYPERVPMLQEAIDKLAHPACQCAVAAGSDSGKAPWEDRDIRLFLDPTLDYMPGGGANGFTWGGLSPIGAIYLNPALDSASAMAGTIAHEAGHFAWPYLGHKTNGEKRFENPTTVCGGMWPGGRDAYFKDHCGC